jgi:hypothetical protein
MANEEVTNDEQVRKSIRKHLLNEVCDLNPVGHISLAEVDANRKMFAPFVALMDKEMRHGYYRYGRNDPGEPARIKYFEHILLSVQLYKETGNWHHLVDAANSCRLESLFPSIHAETHFAPDDDGDHHAEFIAPEG